MEPTIFRYNYSIPGPNNTILDTYKYVSRDEFIRLTGLDPYSKEYRNNPFYKFGQPHLFNN